MTDESRALVRLSIQNGIARLALARPDKRNALSRKLIAELQEAVNVAAADHAARLIVLAAEGPVFCAGMDLAEMQSRTAQPDARELWHEDTRVYRDLLWSLVTLDKPVLAVVQGPALAGGLGLVLACDLVLAGRSATFALPEPTRGITAAVVAPLLTFRVGVGSAAWLLLSGRSCSSEEALRVGLCHELAEDANLASAADSLAASILTGAPSSLSSTKQLLMATAGRKLAEDLQAGMQVSAEARQSDDAREGLAAFLEKRPPAWSQE